LSQPSSSSVLSTTPKDIDFRALAQNRSRLIADGQEPTQAVFALKAVLKKHRFKQLGPDAVMRFMANIGLINFHPRSCCCFQQCEQEHQQILQIISTSCASSCSSSSGRWVVAAAAVCLSSFFPFTVHSLSLPAANSAVSVCPHVDIDGLPWSASLLCYYCYVHHLLVDWGVDCWVMKLLFVVVVWLLVRL